MARLPTSTPALDAEEQEWWQEFGDLEEQYCWVQPPSVQRLLRGRYVQEIAALVRPGDRVLELGCGTGWLSVLLAEAGVQLTGIDFSAGQIARAEATARAHGVAVDFRVADLATLVAEGQRFDVVVTHAFLHHLATDEVRTVLAEAAAALVPGGTLVAVEPVVHPAGRTTRTRLERVLFRLEHVPNMLSKRRLRRQRPAEAELRRRVEGRGRGVAPLGPSPKETAFVGDELVRLLGEQVALTRRAPVASMTFRVAEQVLLAEVSQPRAWRAARGPILRLARSLDRRLVEADPPLRDVWIFELYVGRAAA